MTRQEVCRVVFFFYLLYFYYQIAENIIEISRTTGILVDPVYNIKAIRGMLTEMKNNPGRFKGKRILYIHTGTIFHHYIHLPPSYMVVNFRLSVTDKEPIKCFAKHKLFARWQS